MKRQDIRCWAEVSPDNLLHNYSVLRSFIPEKCRFLGVVKADAYGHGAPATARLLEKAGADYLAVACLDEALELRDAGIQMPILILGHTPAEYTRILIARNVTQTVTGISEARAFSAAATAEGSVLRIHIAVDSGMSRLGFLCTGSSFERGVAEIADACTLPGLDPEGIFTHFAVSDETGDENEAYTRLQFSTFLAAIRELSARDIVFRIRHCANSGAVLRYPEMYLDMVRPGLLLYGYGDENKILDLRPCMRLMTRVLTVKAYGPGTTVSYGRHYATEQDTRMAVLGIGYADGLPRLCSNRFSVAFSCGSAPQRGSICMDMCMVDITSLPEVKAGDAAEIFGPSSDLNRLSQLAQTIPYELLCAVSKRVPRITKDF